MQTGTDEDDEFDIGQFIAEFEATTAEAVKAWGQELAPLASAAIDEGLFAEFKQKWKGAIEDLVKHCAGQRHLDLTLEAKTLGLALRENAAKLPHARHQSATKVLSAEVVKAGRVVQALGEKLKAGAALALADGGCEVFAGHARHLATDRPGNARFLASGGSMQSAPRLPRGRRRLAFPTSPTMRRIRGVRRRSHRLHRRVVGSRGAWRAGFGRSFALLSGVTM
jgi:hypothetical protein